MLVSVLVPPVSDLFMRNETEIFDKIGGEKAWRRLRRKRACLGVQVQRIVVGRQFDPDYNRHADAEAEEDDRWDSRWECKEDWANIGNGDVLNQ